MKSDHNILAADNLIRLHPNEGGRNASLSEQYFQGVSPDVFIALDLNNMTTPFIITRKFNITIKINPKSFTCEEFFRFFTRAQDSKSDPFDTGALAPTDKCVIHGDKEKGLQASSNLMTLLCQENLERVDGNTCSFKVNNSHYSFHSIGVAANQNYGPVGDRDTSHFEIKFKRQDASGSPTEFLCLNIHLTAGYNKLFNKLAVKDRFEKAIRLFYAELGVLKGSISSQTRFKTAMIVNLENYMEHKFSCKNEQSINVLAVYKKAKANTESLSSQRPTHRGSFFSTVAKPADKEQITKTSCSKVSMCPNNAFWVNENDFPSLSSSKKPSLRP